MKEDTLNSLKLEVKEIKEKNKLNNEKIKKIRKLEKNALIKEYLELIGQDKNNEVIVNETYEQIIKRIYRKYLYQINEEDTNKIYVYIGTYKYTDSYDCEHYDEKVCYNHVCADYRIYADIEQTGYVNLPILKCKKFEENNIIIDPKSFLKEKEYYKIQTEFFVKVAMSSQKSAKKMILKNYPLLHRGNK